MKYCLAAYDLGHRSSSGFYWVFHHPSLSAITLSKAYDAVRESGLPDKPNDWPPDFLKAGFGRLDDRWFLLYRCYNGGYDEHGRPQRWVVLCAFLRADELMNRDPTKLLSYGAFAEWSRTPVPLPLPIPIVLEGEIAPEPPATNAPENLRKLNDTGRLEGITLSAAASLVASSFVDRYFRMSISGPAQRAVASVWCRHNRTLPPKKTPETIEGRPDSTIAPDVDLPKAPPKTRDTSDAPRPIKDGLLKYLTICAISFLAGAAAQRFIHLIPERSPDGPRTTISAPASKVGRPMDDQGQPMPVFENKDRKNRDTRPVSNSNGK